jgi:hypothetical protein
LLVVPPHRPDAREEGMSEEEWQVVNNEWRGWLSGVRDDLWDMRKDDLPDHAVDDLAKITNIINKVLTDMHKLSWKDGEVDGAINVVSGYVVHSNAERQRRRDDDLAKHKIMVEKAAEKRAMLVIQDGLATAKMEVAAAAKEVRLANNRIDLAEKRVADRLQEIDQEHVRWALDQKVEFDKAVEAEVTRRLTGGAASAIPGRTKRPVIIG